MPALQRRLQRSAMPLDLELGTNRAGYLFGQMEYHGVKYTITQGTQPDVWRWRVMVGKPEMLRMGEATTQVKAEIEVWRVIDRALEVQKRLQSLERSDKPADTKR